MQTCAALTHSLAHTPPLSDTRRCDIIQLAAISGDRTFNEHMMPQVAIDRKATALTGLRVKHGRLLQHGRALHTVLLHEALAAFLDFLWSLKQPVLLAAHNARRFDKPVLDRALFRCCLTRQFQQLGSRFLDTLPLSRALYPRLRRHSLPYLCDTFGLDYNAHDASEDVTVLQQLYDGWNPDPRSVSLSLFRSG